MEESRPNYILARSSSRHGRGVESEDTGNRPLAGINLWGALLGVFWRMLRLILDPGEVSPNKNTIE